MHLQTHLISGLNHAIRKRVGNWILALSPHNCYLTVWRRQTSVYLCSPVESSTYWCLLVCPCIILSVLGKQVTQVFIWKSLQHHQICKKGHFMHVRTYRLSTVISSKRARDEPKQSGINWFVSTLLSFRSL